MLYWKWRDLKMTEGCNLKNEVEKIIKGCYIENEEI